MARDREGGKEGGKEGRMEGEREGGMDGWREGGREGWREIGKEGGREERGGREKSYARGQWGYTQGTNTPTVL